MQKTMVEKEIERLKLRHNELKDKSYKLSDLAVGTIQEKWLPCGKPNCKCKKENGKKHGPYHYLFYPKREKQGMASIYLPNDIALIMENRVENFKRFENELRELMSIEYKLRKLKVK